jgi:RNA polymerase subunit RPABC4/transcription elongation factor Spt4
MKTTLLILMAVVMVGCGNKIPVSKPKPASAPKYSSRIIKCHDCRGIVSKTAASCPHCGSTDYIGRYYPASKWPKKITVRDPDETEPR